jgi:hypothetical protein
MAVTESGEPLEPRFARQARNEAQVREINERIESFNKSLEEHGFRDELMRFQFQCECGAGAGGAPGCEEQVEMTLQEYEEVRAQDDRFLVRPGHENPQLEDIVRQTERYVIVDKKPSVEPLVADDARGAPPS